MQEVSFTNLIKTRIPKPNNSQPSLYGFYPHICYVLCYISWEMFFGLYSELWEKHVLFPRKSKWKIYIYNCMVQT